MDSESSSRVGHSEHYTLDQQASTSGSLGPGTLVTLSLQDLRAILQEDRATTREETRAMIREEIVSGPARIAQATMPTMIPGGLATVPGSPADPNIGSTLENQSEQYSLNWVVSELEEAEQLGGNEADPSSTGTTTTQPQVQFQGLDTSQGLSGHESLQTIPEASDAFLGK